MATVGHLSWSRKFICSPRLISRFHRTCHDMKSGFWRKCRLTIRWLRRLLLLTIAVLLGIVLWCNRVGIPEFLKKPLVEKLRAHGIELEFSRMRLHWGSGLVAENVHIGGMNLSNAPSL